MVKPGDDIKFIPTSDGRYVSCKSGIPKVGDEVVVLQDTNGQYIAHKSGSVKSGDQVTIVQDVNGKYIAIKGGCSLTEKSVLIDRSFYGESYIFDDYVMNNIILIGIVTGPDISTPHGSYDDTNVCIRKYDYKLNLLSETISKPSMIREKEVMIRRLTAGMTDPPEPYSGFSSKISETTIKLSDDSVPYDTIYNGFDIVIFPGTPLEQRREITEYIGKTKEGTVDIPWENLDRLKSYKEIEYKICPTLNYAINCNDVFQNGPPWVYSYIMVQNKKEYFVYENVISDNQYMNSPTLFLSKYFKLIDKDIYEEIFGFAISINNDIFYAKQEHQNSQFSILGSAKIFDMTIHLIKFDNEGKLLYLGIINRNGSNWMVMKIDDKYKYLKRVDISSIAFEFSTGYYCSNTKDCLLISIEGRQIYQYEYSTNIWRRYIDRYGLLWDHIPLLPHELSLDNESNIYTYFSYRMKLMDDLSIKKEVISSYYSGLINYTNTQIAYSLKKRPDMTIYIGGLVKQTYLYISPCLQYSDYEPDTRADFHIIPNPEGIDPPQNGEIPITFEDITPLPLVSVGWKFDDAGNGDINYLSGGKRHTHYYAFPGEYVVEMWHCYSEKIDDIVCRKLIIVG